MTVDGRCAERLSVLVGHGVECGLAPNFMGNHGTVLTRKLTDFTIK